jgi:hypothetical protein
MQPKISIHRTSCLAQVLHHAPTLLDVTISRKITVGFLSRPLLVYSATEHALPARADEQEMGPGIHTQHGDLIRQPYCFKKVSFAGKESLPHI